MLSEDQSYTPTILIVDDNLNNLQILGGFLQKEGLSVEFAMNGLSALDWLSQKKIDIILLDIMMPGMDGFEVCLKIRENPANREIPVIFITAKADTESIIKGFKTGAVDYITKPFIQSELLARVKTHLKIEQSKRQVIHYLNKIEERNLSINSSITYARIIQKAVLNTPEVNPEYLPDHFILDVPKDILSGDFYWINNIKGQVIFAVMDCSGHGVPGALMSILGATLLIDTIIHENILQPDKILESLRSKLIFSLGQDQDFVNVKDSIEGSIIKYNPDSGILEFAGTLNPAIHIRNNEITEIKADRIPIGFYEKTVLFSLKTVNIEKGDILYLFSDGYKDQFGGPETKKLMSRRFRDLLLEYHDFPMETQKIKLKEYLKLWKKDAEQIDDVLVVGIKF